MIFFKSRSTQHTLDAGDSAAFSSIFQASSFFCSQSESTPAHPWVTQTVGQFSIRKEIMKTKTFTTILLITLILASCAPETGKVVPTGTSDPQIAIPSNTPKPTSTPTVPPTTTPTATPLPAFPGTYITSITREDIKNGGGSDLSLNGEWLLKFPAITTAANYDVLLNNTRAWGGTIVADGNKIKITTSDTGRDCQGEGIYTWTFDGAQLILTAESDSCTTRKVILSQHPLVRLP
jgi:hypothetical protein